MARVLFGVVLAGVALELLLQTISYWQWRRATQPHTAGEGPVVLCIGDSFTYGIGAAQPSGAYPAQAEACAMAAGTPLRFVNAGWPGQRSREMLLRLEAQIRAYRPFAIYVLGGVNDLGTGLARVTPNELEAAAKAAGVEMEFALRLRLPHFLQLLAQWCSGGPAYTPRELGKTLAGDWHVGALAVTFAPDGRLLLSHTEHPMGWYVNGKRLMLRSYGLAEFDAECDFDGERLGLAIPGLPERLVLTRGQPAELPPLDRARRALQLGDVATARAGFAALLGGGEDTVARVGLVRALVASGDAAAATPLVELLVARAGDANATGAHVEAALRALVATSRTREALAMAASAYRSGLQPPIWELLNGTSQEPAAHREVHAAIDAALAADDLPAAFRAQLLRARVHDRARRAPRDALRDLLLAELVAPHPVFTSSLLPSLGADRAKVDEVLDELHSPPAQRAAIARMVASPGGPYSADGATLAAHLRAMHALGQRYSATVILVGYPLPEPTIERAQRSAAAATGMPILPTREVFAARLVDQGWADLFVVDGHCNARGYALIAELVATDAMARRPR